MQLNRDTINRFCCKNADVDVGSITIDLIMASVRDKNCTCLLTPVMRSLDQYATKLKNLLLNNLVQFLVQFVTIKILDIPIVVFNLITTFRRLDCLRLQVELTLLGGRNR
jgi:hypothetical protein